MVGHSMPEEVGSPQPTSRLLAGVLRRGRLAELGRVAIDHTGGRGSGVDGRRRDGGGLGVVVLVSHSNAIPIRRPVHAPTSVQAISAGSTDMPAPATSGADASSPPR